MSTTRKEWVVKTECELRCDVRTETLTVKLVDGTAEVFGIELAKGKEYQFRNQNIAIFTWYGCKLETQGDAEMYVADSTPMVSYANAHVQLEARRDYALQTGCDGPRVLIVGPADSGKATLARILTAYAARLDRNVMYVDLDVRDGFSAVPGSLSATPIEKTNLHPEVSLLLAALM
jgi:polyribonucleotide 5'-hydroxyl-kinase